MLASELTDALNVINLQIISYLPKYVSPTNVCSSISLNSHDVTCFTGSVQQSIPQEKKQHPQPHTHTP